MIGRGHGRNFLVDFGRIRGVRLSGLATAMQHRNGEGDARDKGAHGEAILAHVEAAGMVAGEICDAVGLVKREGKLVDRDFEAHMPLKASGAMW